ncbi:MAG: MFS transporter [Burkholderiaceae bacterium]
MPSLARSDPTGAAPPPAARGAWPARLAALDLGLMFMASTLVTPLYGPWRAAFGFSALTLTLVYATYVVGNLVALLLFGRLSDQVGRRRASLPALGVAAAAMLVFAFAQSTAWLYVGRALTGLAVGVAGGAVNAWLAELVPGGDRARASTLAIAANLVGIAAGPLLAGALAEFAPAPLVTPFVVFLVLLAAVAACVATLPETAGRRLSFARASFVPRLGVPVEIRAAFAPVAVAAFSNFAFGGYYAGLIPKLMADDLGVRSLAAVGAIVFETYFAGAAAVLLARRLPSRTAMLWGLALVVPGTGGLLLARAEASLALLAATSVVGGAGFGLCYRGALQVVQRIAPDTRRAEVVSCFLLACFLGNSLPVVGVGLLSQVASADVAEGSFAAMVVVLAVAAIATGLRWIPKEGR